MDRVDLLNALDLNRAADAACREAIQRGGMVKIYAGHVPVEQLVRTYSIRVRHLAAMGTDTIGSEDVIGRLSSADGPVRLATVDTPERHFVVFVDPADERVVASWGVPARHKDDDQADSVA